MGSSGGGTPPAPVIPAPTGAPINPPGQTPFHPGWVNFLTPNQVTSSISPQAIQQMQAQQMGAEAAARAKLAQAMAPQAAPPPQRPIISQNYMPGGSMSPFSAASNSGGGYQYKPLAQWATRYRGGGR
jgi:hypothetical protein